MRSFNGFFIYNCVLEVSKQIIFNFSEDIFWKSQFWMNFLFVKVAAERKEQSSIDRKKTFCEIFRKWQE